MKCATCGDDHDLLEPTFPRPVAVVALSSAERSQRVKEGDDLCVIRARSEGEPHRCFVRCLTEVRTMICHWPMPEMSSAGVLVPAL
jgi:hypothetical protein